MNPPRPFYFPVKSAPFRNDYGLADFGANHGNAGADQRYFQFDATTPGYLEAKARIIASHPERNSGSDPTDHDQPLVLDAAARWMSNTLLLEGHRDASELPLSEVGRALAEDFVILRRTPDGGDRAIWVHVCFPSGWAPEHILGKSFASIHGPVPSFVDARASAKFVSRMISTGPYTRFVWTISADDELDHHPTQGRRDDWSEHTRPGFLRVERQTTIPLPPVAACIFLIRTYLYAFDELPDDARSALASALGQMPAEFSKYKRLETAIPHALRLLENA